MICPEFLWTQYALQNDTNKEFEGSAIWTRPLDRIEFILRTPYPKSCLESPLDWQEKKWTRLDMIHDLHDTKQDSAKNLQNAFWTSAMFLTYGSPYLDMLMRSSKSFNALELWNLIQTDIQLQKSEWGKKAQEIGDMTPQDATLMVNALDWWIWIYDTVQDKMRILSAMNYSYFRNQKDYSHRPAELAPFVEHQTILQ